jgi:hypothetical protein
MGKCKHGVPLVATIGGPSAYCRACDDAYVADPRYYADGAHLPSATLEPEASQGTSPNK